MQLAGLHKPSINKQTQIGVAGTLSVVLVVSLLDLVACPSVQGQNADCLRSVRQVHFRLVLLCPLLLLVRSGLWLVRHCLWKEYRLSEIDAAGALVVGLVVSPSRSCGFFRHCPWKECKLSEIDAAGALVVGLLSPSRSCGLSVTVCGKNTGCLRSMLQVPCW